MMSFLLKPVYQLSSTKQQTTLWCLFNNKIRNFQWYKQPNQHQQHKRSQCASTMPRRQHNALCTQTATISGIGFVNQQMRVDSVLLSTNEQQLAQLLYKPKLRLGPTAGDRDQPPPSSLPSLAEQRRCLA